MNDTLTDRLLQRVIELEARLARLESTDRKLGDIQLTLGDTAGANKLTLRDSTPTEVFSVDSNGNVTGTLGTFNSGVKVPKSSGAALYALDTSSVGSSIAIANNGTAAPLGSGVALRGPLSVWSNGDGVGAFLFADSGGCSIISDRAGIFSTTAGTGSKINVYVTGGTLTIENKRGSSITVSVVCWRVA